MDNAFEWIAEGNALCTAAQYPYTCVYVCMCLCTYASLYPQSSLSLC